MLLQMVLSICVHTVRQDMNACILESRGFPECVCEDPPVGVYWYGHDMLLAVLTMTLTMMYGHDMLLAVIAITRTLMVCS